MQEAGYTESELGFADTYEAEEKSGRAVLPSKPRHHYSGEEDETETETDDDERLNTSSFRNNGNKRTKRLSRPKAFNVQSSRTVLLYILAASIAVVCVKMNQERDLESVSHYERLDVAKDASMRDIRKQYLKFAKRFHPDSNPACISCSMQFAAISRAYQVLSDETSRAAYDAAEIEVDAILSHTTELTTLNVDEFLLSGIPVSLVLVYVDHDSRCISASNAWECAYGRLGNYIKFGRLHALKQVELLRSLSLRVRSLPAAALFVQGRFQRLLPVHESCTAFVNLLAASYPDTISKIAPGQIDALLGSEPEGAADVGLLILSEHYTPSLLARSVALRLGSLLAVSSCFSHSLRSKANQREFLSSLLSLRDISGSTPRAFPAAIIFSAHDASWISLRNGTDLTTTVQVYLRQRVLRLRSSWQYESVCSHSGCVVLVHSCPPGRPDAQSSATALAMFTSVSSPTMQLATIDAGSHSEFAALCSSSRAWRVLAVQPDSFLLEMHDELSVDSLLQFMSMVASPSKRRALIAAFGEEEVLPPTIWNTGRSSGRSWLLSALILLTALLLFVLCYLLLHSSFLSHILLLVFVGGLLFELIWSSIVSKLGF